MRPFQGASRLRETSRNYFLTGAPSYRRLQLTSGYMILRLDSAEITSDRRLKNQDRNILAGVLKTKFSRGGTIEGKKYSTPALLKKVWNSFPGTMTILVN